MERKEYRLTEITPKDFDCGIGVCPRIYDTGKDKYILIGKQVNPADAGLEKKVGDDELLVEIPRELLSELGGRLNDKIK